MKDSALEQREAALAERESAMARATAAAEYARSEAEALWRSHKVHSVACLRTLLEENRHACKTDMEEHAQRTRLPSDTREAALIIICNSTTSQCLSR